MAQIIFGLVYQDGENKGDYSTDSKGTVLRDTIVDKIIPKFDKANFENGGFSGSISGNIPVDGSVGFEFGYSYKYRTCFPVPYAFRLDGVRASGELQLDKAIVAMDGRFTAASGWQSQDYKLIKGDIGFWLGPIPIKLVYQLDTYLGFDAGVTITGTARFNNPLTGIYKFNYYCTMSDCDGTNSSTIQFAKDDSALAASATIDAVVAPYVGLRLSGYVWDEWLAHAGIGAEISTQLGLLGLVATHCGDGDGDGVEDVTSSLALDATAQIAIYGQWGTLGRKRAKWLNLNLKPSGWDNVRIKNVAGRIAGNEFQVIQRSLFFKEFVGDRRTSAFSPILSGKKSVDTEDVESYSLSMRSCLPARYKNKINYLVNWGDGSSSEVRSPDARPIVISHKWSEQGDKAIRITTVSDHIGRKINTSSHRTIKVSQGTKISKTVWKATPVITANNTSSVMKQVRVLMDRENLYVMIEKNRLGVNSALLINSDGDSSTGHQSHFWGLQSGADHMLANGIIYSSDSSAWSWSTTGFPAHTIARDGYYEFSIPLTAFGRRFSPKSFSLAFLEQDANFNVVDKIPAGNAFAAADNSIIESANVKFWDTLPVLTSAENQVIKQMKASIRGGYLFVKIEGRDFVPTYSLLINADGKQETGFQSYVWPKESGAEFMISAASLYRSKGNDAQWNWEKIGGEVGVTSLDNSMEFRIPLARLNLHGSVKPNIKISFNLVDGKFNAYGKLPVGDKFSPVTDFVAIEPSKK